MIEKGAVAHVLWVYDWGTRHPPVDAAPLTTNHKGEIANLATAAGSKLFPGWDVYNP